MDTIYYSQNAEYIKLMMRYHTVSSLQAECQRSRAWAYNMIASHPRPVLLRNMRTGKEERAIPRTYVTQYMHRVRRGNPNW